jgi:hypothetical protein
VAGQTRIKPIEGRRIERQQGLLAQTSTQPRRRGVLGWRELEHSDEQIAPHPGSLPPLGVKFMKKNKIVHHASDAVPQRLD